MKNLYDFFASFAKSAYYRQPILSMLGSGLSAGLLKHIGLKPKSVIRARQASKKNTRYPIASFRESIPIAESRGLTDWVMTKVTGKSGSPGESYYCALTRQQLHEEYLSRPHKVWSFIAHYLEPKDIPQARDQSLTRFERNVVNYDAWVKRDKKGPVILTGRSYMKFFEIISHLHLNFNVHPKVCKRCNNHLKVETDLIALVRKQTDKPHLNLQKEIDELALKVQASRIHQQQVERQRNYINSLRDNLGPNDRAIILDFVSTYGLTSKKFNFLVFIVFRKQDEVLSHEFHDFFADPGVKHDSPFSRWAIETLFRTGVFRGVRRLYISTDCGSTFKNYNLVYFLSSLGPRFNVQVECHFFAPSHGFSLCDAHGGCIKKILNQVQVQREEGFERAIELVETIREYIAENRFSVQTHPYIFELPDKVYDLYFPDPRDIAQPKIVEKKIGGVQTSCCIKFDFQPPVLPDPPPLSEDERRSKRERNAARLGKKRAAALLLKKSLAHSQAKPRKKKKQDDKEEGQDDEEIEEQKEEAEEVEEEEEEEKKKEEEEEK